jgi:hypothetical protein
VLFPWLDEAHAVLDESRDGRRGLGTLLAGREYTLDGRNVVLFGYGAAATVWRRNES